MKKNKLTDITIATVLTLIVMSALVLLTANRYTVHDFISSLSYTPSSPEISNIQTELNLTYPGELLFKASTPTLEESEDFNKNCKSYNPGISVLGCFDGKKIHVFKIESEELNGVSESTTAHEMLHAVWHRLSKAEQEKLQPDLDKIFEAHQEELAAVNDYPEEEHYDELFARVGTEIHETSDSLEEIYKRYFNNRAEVVGYYEKYHKIFNELAKKIKTLVPDIEALEASVEAKTAEYKTRSEKLTADVNEFNECAETVGCFTAATFSERRAELSAEQDDLTLLYAEISSEIDTHNRKVAEYNQNALKTVYYSDLINSNTERNDL